MTAEELNEGMQITISAAHQLRAELGRNPRTCEIRWRAATAFQRQYGLVRREAVRHADLMIDAVTSAASTT